MLGVHLVWRESSTAGDSSAASQVVLQQTHQNTVVCGQALLVPRLHVQLLLNLNLSIFFHGDLWADRRENGSYDRPYLLHGTLFTKDRPCVLVVVARGESRVARHHLLVGLLVC